MSTKIYDAYKFPRKLNIDELSKTVLEQRPLITFEAQKLYFGSYIHNFVRHYDQYKLKPRKDITAYIADLNANIAATSDDILKRRYKETISIYTSLLAGDYSGAAISVDWCLQTLVEAKKDKPYSPFNYKSSLLVIPCGPKLLAMTFGNGLLNGTLVNNLGLEDYHYQNQTDRPNNISSRAWETRRKTWNKAIGPDYVPINHGFEFNLVDDNYISLVGIRLYERHLENEFENLFTKDFVKSLIPDIESRANMIVETLKDYPNPPTKDSHYTEWLACTRTDEYKKWKAKKIKQTIKKLENSDVFDVLCNTLNLA